MQRSIDERARTWCCVYRADGVPSGAFSLGVITYGIKGYALSAVKKCNDIHVSFNTNKIT